MKVYNREQMPFKVLYEAAYWKLQELNYTVLMSKLAKNLAQEQTNHFKQWEYTFDTTHRQIHRFIESAPESNEQFRPQLYEQVLDLVTFCLQESVRFIHFCYQLKKTNESTINDLMIQEVIDHVINQSDDFVGFAQATLHQKAH